MALFDDAFNSDFFDSVINKAGFGSGSQAVETIGKVITSQINKDSTPTGQAATAVSTEVAPSPVSEEAKKKMLIMGAVLMGAVALIVVSSGGK